MSDDEVLEIGFTQVLYGVVVASAISQLTFAPELRNVMLLFSLAFILGDWIEYQIAIREASGTTSNYVTGFIFDVTILVIWHLLTTLSISELDWFFLIAGTFFYSQGIWDRLILQVEVGELVTRPHLQLALFFIILAVVERISAILPAVLLASSIAVFFVRKYPMWKKLIRKSPDAL